MHAIDQIHVRKGSEVGRRIRFRIRRGFLWNLGFVLGFIGVSK